MRSAVAEYARQQARAEVLALPAAERVRLAFELGDRDAVIYCATTGVDRAEALRTFRRNRQHGRRPSAVIEGLNK